MKMEEIMQSKTTSKIIGWILALGILTSGTLALACNLPHKVGYYPARPYYSNAYYGNRVNTPVEYRFDTNHNGWIGPQERIAMANYRVNSRREQYCDFNRNGFVDTWRERGCL